MPAEITFDNARVSATCSRSTSPLSSSSQSHHNHHHHHHKWQPAVTVNVNANINIVNVCCRHRYHHHIIITTITNITLASAAVVAITVIMAPPCGVSVAGSFGIFVFVSQACCRKCVLADAMCATLFLLSKAGYFTNFKGAAGDATQMRKMKAVPVTPSAHHQWPNV